MERSVKTLGLIVIAFATVNIAGTAVYADTPEEKLSRILLRGKYRVTNGYQPNRVHAGIDFGGAGDGITRVNSPVTGKIVANTTACGKVAIFDGRNTIILAHMKNRTSLGIGKTIYAGAYLGLVSKVLGGGCSATAAHLHIEIRTGNHPTMAAPGADNRSTTINPATYIAGTSPAMPPSAPPNANPPAQEPIRPPTTPPAKAIDNDIGKSKKNEFYEITVENAWASRDPVRLDICKFDVPSGQKAILVRFAIRRASQPRTNEEILRLGYTQTTDFVLTDDQNKRLDPACLVTGIVLGASDRAVNRTLAYLVPAGSQHVSFRFQKSGAGRPIVFDLSGLD